MSTALLIYLYVLFGNLRGLAIFFIALCLFFVLFSPMLFVFIDDEEEALITIKKIAKKLFYWVAIPSIMLIALYPNKEDLILIVGGTALISVAQTEEAQKLPENVLKAANAFLEGVYEAQ